MPRFEDEIIKRRIEALRLARVDSAMEGLYEHPDDATALDAFALGEIDRAEFMRRVRLRPQAPARKHRYGR